MNREIISAKNFIGLKPGMFSPANLSTSTVLSYVVTYIHHTYACHLAITLLKSLIAGT